MDRDRLKITAIVLAIGGFGAYAVGQSYESTAGIIGNPSTSAWTVIGLAGIGVGAVLGLIAFLAR